ncbi:hypothetical protein HDU86_000453 [Geranomyces michiganensis]|nr:hypothetical protein HDU86_000453 [Geranomyces michiganensis]
MLESSTSTEPPPPVLEDDGLAPALGAPAVACTPSSPTSNSKLPKEKTKRPPKPGSKAAILLKHQQQRQQRELVSAASSADEFTLEPPIATFDEATCVLILCFRNPPALAAALLRPHVVYEGGHLNGPLKGVNFSSLHYTTWLASPQSPPLTPAEQTTAVLVPATTKYICAYIRNDRSTLLHEWAHARFFVSETYRALCVEQWAALDAGTVKVIRKELEMRGYREDVYIDEWQAYCVEGPGEFGKKAGRALSVAHCTLKREVGAPPSPPT